MKNFSNYLSPLLRAFLLQWVLISAQASGCFVWTRVKARFSEGRERTAHGSCQKVLPTKYVPASQGSRVKWCFELLIHAITWVNPQNMLSERSQTQPNPYSIYMELRTGKPITETEIRMCSLGVGEGK